MARPKFFVPPLPKLRKHHKTPANLAIWLLKIESRAWEMRVTDAAVIEFAKSRARGGGKLGEAFVIIDANARFFSKPKFLRRYLRARGFGPVSVCDLSFLLHRADNALMRYEESITVFCPADMSEAGRARLAAVLAGTNAALYVPREMPVRPLAEPFNVEIGVIVWHS